MIPKTPPSIREGEKHASFVSSSIREHKKNACKGTTVVIDANVKPINKKLKQVRKLAKKVNKELERTTELLSNL